MKLKSPPKLVDLLLDTLERVEEKSGSCPDEAAMQKLKSRVIRLVAQFEAIRSREGATAGGAE
jgi:hypothetical protein